MTKTADSSVFIEGELLTPAGQQYYVRYRNTAGRRWEVFGVCDMRGDCIQGAVDPLFGPRRVRLDVPVTPEFKGCCPFTFKELDGGD